MTSDTRTVHLPCDTRSVAVARRFCHEALLARGHGRFVDDCQLLVSELVTNAVLHGGTAIELRCIVDTHGVRVEVRDGSSVLPGPRHYDVTASTGRGIRLVDALAAKWGAHVEATGKVVWFELGEPSDPRPVGAPEPSDGNGADHFVARLASLPVELLRVTLQHGDELLRDVAMFEMQSSGTHRSWRSPQIDLTPLLELVNDARTKGQTVITIDARFPRREASGALECLARVNEAEELARTDVVRTRPALPEIRACRTWVLSQIALQAEGAVPTPWVLPENLEPVDPPLTLTSNEERSLEQARTAVVVADSTHRIVFASRAASELLGWSVGSLVGRRLSVLVPTEHREAHLAGYARYAFTKEPRMLGREMMLPVLCQDGSTRDFLITVQTRSFELGSAFAAEFRTTGPS